MIKSLIQQLCIGLMLLFCQQLFADNLLVIVAKDSTNSKMSRRQLDRIFRRKTLINKQGEPWVPVNLSIENPLRLAFSKKIFKQNPVDMETFWNIQYFKGISPPYVVTSEEAIIRFVNSTPGAIGYIAACHLDSRVQVVMKLTVHESINDQCEFSNKH